MKTYRLITLIGAVLITVFFARVFSDQRVGGSQNQAHASALEAP